MKKLQMYALHHEKQLFIIASIMIAVVALFLRLYGTPARYSLDGDSVRDAVVAVGGARAGQLPLTGPFSSTGPFTFGPWYYYQLIFFAFLLHTPFAPWISMVIVSLACIPVMFGIGRELHNKWFGLLLAAMVTVTSTQVAIASSLSNINPVSLFSALAIWATIALVKRKKASLWWGFFARSKSWSGDQLSLPDGRIVIVATVCCSLPPI